MAENCRLLAAWTNTPNQALCNNQTECRRKQKRFDPHIDEPGNGRYRVICVKGGKYKMARKRCAYGYFRSLTIPDFTNHNDIRILTQQGTKCGGKIITDVGLDLGLIDSLHFILNGIFNR